MHPNKVFDWTDRSEMLAFIGEVAFCTIFVDGPLLIHVPVVVHAPDRIRFHVANRNRAVASLDGRRGLLSCLGPNAYISPDWYGTDDQVPTWNYVTVEAEGPIRQLDTHELTDQLDRLSAAHEARLAPKKEWTRDKMSPGRFDAMLKAITGFELEIEALRGSRKLGQHKKAAEQQSAAAGLEPFNPAMAALMAAAAKDAAQ